MDIEAGIDEIKRSLEHAYMSLQYERMDGSEYGVVKDHLNRGSIGDLDSEENDGFDVWGQMASNFRCKHGELCLWHVDQRLRNVQLSNSCTQR